MFRHMNPGKNKYIQNFLGVTGVLRTFSLLSILNYNARKHCSKEQKIQGKQS